MTKNTGSHTPKIASRALDRRFILPRLPTLPCSLSVSPFGFPLSNGGHDVGRIAAPAYPGVLVGVRFNEPGLAPVPSF